MTETINHPPRKRKSKATSNRAPVLGALQALNNSLEDLKLLAANANPSPDAIVEIAKLLLMAEVIAKIIKALI